MKVITRGNLKIFIGVDGNSQMSSCMNGTQTVYYGSAFSGSSGLSVSVAATPMIPETLLDEGNLDKIVDYLVEMFSPIASVCEVEIYLGPNYDMADVDGGE